MKNVIIISLDCVREESLSCYNKSFDSILHRNISLFPFWPGRLLSFFVDPLLNRVLKFFIKPSTCNIDNIAQNGILFTEAFTHAPFTPAAHASLFTGLNPYKHSIRKMVGFKLNQEVITLAEILKKNGYSTGGFIGSDALGKQYELNRGFDIYDFAPEKSSWVIGEHRIYKRDCKKVTNAALDWLTKAKRSKFFLFIHYFDAHEGSTNISYQPFWQIIKVRKIDKEIGRILQFLDKNNLYKDSLIIILADHGNSFGEHDEEGHREYLYDTTLKIPMVIKFGSAFVKQVCSFPVQIVDIFPTVVRFLSLTSPLPGNLDGKNILEVIYNKIEYEPVIYSETCIEKLISNPDELKSQYISLRTRNWKIILETISGKIELFNLKEDPHELNNVYYKFPEIAGELFNELFNLIPQDKMINQNRMGQDEIAEIKRVLKSLGYL